MADYPPIPSGMPIEDEFRQWLVADLDRDPDPGLSIRLFGFLAYRLRRRLCCVALDVCDARPDCMEHRRRLVAEMEEIDREIY